MAEKSEEQVKSEEPSKPEQPTTPQNVEIQPIPGISTESLVAGHQQIVRGRRVIIIIFNTRITLSLNYNVPIYLHLI